MRFVWVLIAAAACTLQGCASVRGTDPMAGPTVDGISLQMTSAELRNASEKDLGPLVWQDSDSSPTPVMPGLPVIRARTSIASTPRDHGVVMYMVDKQDRPFFYMHMGEAPGTGSGKPLADEIVRTYGPAMAIDEGGGWYTATFAMDVHGNHLPASPESLKVCNVVKFAAPQELAECQWILSTSVLQLAMFDQPLKRAFSLFHVQRYREAAAAKP
jgi:hypothetical protein